MYVTQTIEIKVLNGLVGSQKCLYEFYVNLYTTYVILKNAYRNDIFRSWNANSVKLVLPIDSIILFIYVD